MTLAHHVLFARMIHSGGELDMPMKKYKPEQIVTLLRQIELEITNGKTTPRWGQLHGNRVSDPWRVRRASGGPFGPSVRLV
jgi:hypothetical protein